VTYAQALSLLKTFFGKDPSLVDPADVQRAYIPLGIPLDLRSTMQTNLYGAVRTGTTLEQRLTDRGFIEAGALTNTSYAPPPTLSGSQYAQQTFENIAKSYNPDIAGYFESQAPTISVPPLPTTSTTSTTTSIYRTDREQIVDGVRYDVMSDGSLRRSSDQTNVAPATTTTQVSDERDRLRIGMGLPPLETVSPQTAADIAGYTETGVPIIMAPIGLRAGTTEVPTVSVPEALRAGSTTPSAVSPSAAGTSAVSPSATSTVAPSSVGPAGDSIAQMEYLNRLAAASALESRSREAYNLALRLAATERETGTRRAEADAYNASLRALASLGARGISTRGGLGIAAQRAARSEPLQRRMQAMEQYLGKTSAAQLLLAEETAKANQARNEAETAMLRANKIASDLSSGATGTMATPLVQSPTTTQSLNMLPPTIQVPQMNWG